MRLRKDIVHNTELSADAIALYISLCYYSDETKLCRLDKFYTGILSGDKGTDCNIINSIFELEKYGYIKVISKDKGHYIIDKSNCRINKDDYYISVNPDDISVIINSGSKNRFTMLRVYVCIIGTFANGDIDLIYKSKVGFMPQSYLAKLCNISIKTLQRVEKQLETLRLIYVAHSRYYKERSYYCLYENAELLIQYRDDKEKKFESKVEIAPDINDNDDFCILDDADCDF